MNTTLATAIAILFAGDDGESASTGGSVFSLVLLLAVPFAMYFFLIRPQRRRAREQADLQSALEVGDEIVTTSGIYGTITGEDGPNRFWIEIDDDVQIRVARAAIQSRVSPDGVDDTDAADDADADADADAASAD